MAKLVVYTRRHEELLAHHHFLTQRLKDSKIEEASTNSDC